MLQKHQVKCSCGSFMIFEVEVGTKISIQCGNCHKVLMDECTKRNDIQLATDESLDNLLVNDVVSTIPETPQETCIPAPSPARKPLVEVSNGVKLDHYNVVKSIGSGAMGKVYLAIDERNQEKVAIKMLNKNSDNKLLDYFIRETQVLMNLKHTNIVALKGWGNYQGSPYIAMEYIDGATLEDYLTQGPIAPRYTLQIMSYVLDALDYAASYQIIHRDVKPSNILIGSNKVVKLIDFGIGKMLADPNLTGTGQMMGTICYMAPEQLQDAKGTDYQADIYAVGATLFHALSGQAPFAEYGKNPMRIMWGKHNNSYIPLKQTKPDLPSSLISLVEKSMHQNPKKRYSGAKEMQNALIEIYNQNYA